MQTNWSQIIHSLSSNSLLILDIDSTLVHTNTRNQVILHDFAKLISTKNSELSELLLTAVCHENEYGYDSALKRINLYPAPAEFSQQLNEELPVFWTKTFFSNEYIKHDPLFHGATQLLDWLKIAPCDYRFLTGRHKESMWPGTWSYFEERGHHFSKDKFILKSDPAEKDELYKSRIIRELKVRYENVVLVDNEPLILNQVTKDHPEVKVVFVDSCHSPKAKSPENVLTISTLAF